MTANTSKALTVSEIVRGHYRTADVFKKWGINFCCGGNYTLAQICDLRQLDSLPIERDLAAAIEPCFIPLNVNCADWPVEFLISYSLHIHHATIKKMAPALEQSLLTFATGHKKKHSYLEAVQQEYNVLVTQLEHHIQNEETKFFPYLLSATKEQLRLPSHSFFNSINNSAQNEHAAIETSRQQLRLLTNDYTFSDDACTNHQVIYRKLKELDAILRHHQQTEVEVLYVKAAQPEKEELVTASALSL